MKKIKDSLVVGILSGLIGILCMDASNFVLWRSKKTEGLYGHLAGSMIMKPSKLKKGKNFLIGQIFHMSVGSSLGIVMTLILKRFGKDHNMIKGGILSFATWGILYNFGQRMGFFRMNPRLTKSSYAAIWHHLIFGVVTSQAIVTLADPTIFPQKVDINTQDRMATQKNTAQSPFYIYSDVNSIKEEGTSRFSM